MIFKELVNNAALLLTLSLLYSFVVRRWRSEEILGQIVNGFLFGGVVVGVMANPMHLMPGVVFDTRSVLVSIAALFCGPLTAIITAVIASAYRLWEGGVGAFTGIMVIFSSAGLGVAYHYWKRRHPEAMRPLYLFGFGIIVHVAMLLCMFTLPWAVALKVLENISLPVMAIYPLGTLLVAILLADPESRIIAEVALEEREKQMQAVLEATADPLVVYDKEGKTEFLNPAFTRVFGWTKEELLGRKIDFVPEVNIAETMNAIKSTYAGGGAHTSFESSRYTKSEDLRDVIVSAALWRDVDGNPKGTVVNLKDITERKRAEEALRESEDRFRTVADFTYNWETWYGPDENWIYVSPSCERITGYFRDDFLNDPSLMEKIAHPEDRDMVSMHLSSELEMEESAHLDFRIITKGGEERWVSHSCQPVYDTEGKYFGRRASNRDITIRKMMELELERHNKDLQEALTKVKQLSGLLPICANCKNIRNDEGYWQRIDTYISQHSEAEFSHGVCPDCVKELYPEIYEEMLAENPELFERK